MNKWKTLNKLLQMSEMQQAIIVIATEYLLYKQLIFGQDFRGKLYKQVLDK